MTSVMQQDSVGIQGLLSVRSVFLRGTLMSNKPPKLCIITILNIESVRSSSNCTLMWKNERISVWLMSESSAWWEAVVTQLHIITTHRWICPFLWRYSSPSNTSLNMVAMLASSNTPVLCSPREMICLMISNTEPERKAEGCHKICSSCMELLHLWMDAPEFIDN